MAKKLIRTAVAAVVLASGMVVLTGCNTMAGAGQDLQKGGNAITNSAEKHKDY